MGLENRNNRNLAYCFEDPMTPCFHLNIQKACDVEWLEIWSSKIPPKRPRGRWAGATKPLADISWNPDWFITGSLYWFITIPREVGRNIMYIQGTYLGFLNTAQMTCSTTSFPIFNKNIQWNRKINILFLFWRTKKKRNSNPPCFLIFLQHFLSFPCFFSLF